MRRLRSAVGLLGAFALCLALCVAPAPARAAEMFKGRSLTIYIGSGPGGGYDLFGRLVARHLGRFLPGDPNISVSNMPGAGSVTAANFLFNAAPKDGTALAVLTPSLSMLDVMAAPGVRFHADQFDWIGRVASIVNVTYTSATSRVKTIADARETPALIAAIDDSSPLTIETRVLDKTAGTRFRLIEGYADSAATQLAVERGEADGATASWNALAIGKRDLLAAHKLNILVQYTSVRHAQLPDTPAALELALTPRDKQVLSLYVNSADVGYSVVAPPNLPADRREALRSAFVAMTKDPQFLADAGQIGAELDPLAGSALQSIVEAAVKIPADVRQDARQAAAH